jgi:hypothetical protein
MTVEELMGHIDAFQGFMMANLPKNHIAINTGHAFNELRSLTEAACKLGTPEPPRDANRDPAPKSFKKELQEPEAWVRYSVPS